MRSYYFGTAALAWLVHPFLLVLLTAIECRFLLPLHLLLSGGRSRVEVRRVRGGAVGLQVGESSLLIFSDLLHGFEVCAHGGGQWAGLAKAGVQHAPAALGGG